LKAARGAGERFIFAVFWRPEKRRHRRMSEFCTGIGSLFNDKNECLFAATSSFPEYRSLAVFYPVCPGRPPSFRESII
jgi:hypothetical protein